MRKRMTKKALLALIMSALLGMTVLGGCSQPEPEPEPMPEPVVVAPEPEPEPEPMLEPLTGFETDNEHMQFIKPLSVKIENTPAARPQLGITRADVVYETITEGGITRFNAMFQSDIPDEVGPVRSARNSDMTIVPQYHGFFFFSGANDQVWQALSRTHINEMNHSSAAPLYHRVSFKAAPHNLYLDTAEAYDYAGEMGYIVSDGTIHALEFGEMELDTADEVDTIFVSYGSSTFDVLWTYDPSTSTYLRTINGVAQVDGDETGAQIAPDNVVVLEIPYVAAAAVEGKGQTYNMNFNGSGKATLFRDGRMIECTWYTDGTSPPRFTDAAGNQVLLKPGKTWFQCPMNPEKVVLTGPSITTQEDTTETDESEDLYDPEAAEAFEED